MSRIGNKVIVIPAGVSVEVNGATVTVKGPKGELVRSFNENITLDIAENEITVKRPNDTKEMKMLHGTKALEMIGVGYRAQLQGTKLVLSVGKSHQDEVEAPENIKFVVATPTSIVVEGISKEAVGQTAAYIRSRRSPEPYKGKGIRYVGEYVRRKEGKTGK